MILNSVSNAAVEKALSGLWQRQRTINHNIANEDTPGYKAKRVDFETVLKSELSAAKREGLSRRESISRLGSLGIQEYELEGQVARADGNNVVLDNEYLEMARVQIQYSAALQKVSGYYSNLKYVIGGGR